VQATEVVYTRVRGIIYRTKFLTKKVKRSDKIPVIRHIGIKSLFFKIILLYFKLFLWRTFLSRVLYCRILRLHIIDVYTGVILFSGMALFPLQFLLIERFNNVLKPL
jgi:hypothetical protein